MKTTKIVTISLPLTVLNETLEQRTRQGENSILSPIGRIACEGRVMTTMPETLSWRITDHEGDYFAGVLCSGSLDAQLGGRETADQKLSALLDIPNPQVIYPTLSHIDTPDTKDGERSSADIELVTHLMLGSWSTNMDILVDLADLIGARCTGWGNPGVGAFRNIVNKDIATQAYFDDEHRLQAAERA